MLQPSNSQEQATRRSFYISNSLLRLLRLLGEWILKTFTNWRGSTRRN
jgi:hypothetical protein